MVSIGDDPVSSGADVLKRIAMKLSGGRPHERAVLARRFIISAIVAAAGLWAGAGIGNLIWAHRTPPVQVAAPQEESR